MFTDLGGRFHRKKRGLDKGETHFELHKNG